MEAAQEALAVIASAQMLKCRLEQPTERLRLICNAIRLLRLSCTVAGSLELLVQM